MAHLRDLGVKALKFQIHRCLRDLEVSLNQGYLFEGPFTMAYSILVSIFGFPKFWETTIYGLRHRGLGLRLQTGRWGAKGG